MSKHTWILHLDSIWTFNQLQFYLGDVGDFTGMEHEYEIRCGLFFGEPIYLRPEIGNDEPVAIPGGIWVRVVADHPGAMEALEEFGISTDLVSEDEIDEKHFVVEPDGDRGYRNAARINVMQVVNMLCDADPYFEDLMAGNRLPHINAPVLSMGDESPAGFYNPSGNALEMPFGHVLLPLADEQRCALVEVCEGIANPYTRGLMLGLANFLGKMVSYKSEKAAR